MVRIHHGYDNQALNAQKTPHLANLEPFLYPKKGRRNPRYRQKRGHQTTLKGLNDVELTRCLKPRRLRRILAKFQRGGWGRRARNVGGTVNVGIAGFFTGNQIYKVGRFLLFRQAHQLDMLGAHAPHLQTKRGFSTIQANLVAHLATCVDFFPSKI